VLSTGWRCPGCGRCYAPFVSQCWICSASFTFSNAKPTEVVCQGCGYYPCRKTGTACPPSHALQFTVGGA
jgi:hypothetical protein